MMTDRSAAGASAASRSSSRRGDARLERHRHYRGLRVVLGLGEQLARHGIDVRRWHRASTSSSHGPAGESMGTRAETWSFASAT